MPRTMHPDNTRDTDMLMDEVFYKDANIKSRLFGIEVSEDHVRRRMIEFNAEFRFMRRFCYGAGSAIILSLIGIIFRLWLD